jgi:hypothetical protein
MFSLSITLPGWRNAEWILPLLSLWKYFHAHVNTLSHRRGPWCQNGLDHHPSSSVRWEWNPSNYSCHYSRQVMQNLSTDFLTGVNRFICASESRRTDKTCNPTLSVPLQKRTSQPKCMHILFFPHHHPKSIWMFPASYCVPTTPEKHFPKTCFSLSWLVVWQMKGWICLMTQI